MTDDERKNTNSIPGTPAFSAGFMDKSADPVSDFYHYAAGNWLKTRSIPEDKSTWGAFDELLERNNALLRSILEACIPVSSDKTVEGMLGRFYQSALDTQTIENRKFEPIRGLIERIDKIDTIDSMIETVSLLHRTGIPSFFHVYSDPDKKESSRYALYIDQAGLSLPDREYYLSDDFSGIRTQYLRHMANMFSLMGSDGNEAGKNAETVLALETLIAKFSRPQADLRDAERNYNRYRVDDLAFKFGKIGLGKYLTYIQIPDVENIVIGQPEFMKSLQDIVSSRPIEDWKIYLKWNVLNTAASLLHSDAEKEHFDFFNRKLLGQEKPEPRWKTAIEMIDSCIGEALGELYVRKHFGKDAKERMKLMIEDISNAFASKLSSLAWMGEETRKLALQKFRRFRAKIGYPDRFRDYSSIEIKENDYFGNVVRSEEFEFRRQVKRIGKQVDPNEWYMSPPTVNAYFSPTDNEIVFPAGILQPPFFDVSMDDAVNYGSIGGVISHEITHGYDDQGRKYDADGNLKDWWSEEDREEFMKRAKRVVDLYSSVEVLPGMHINGELTLGENIADFGGVSIAYEALQRRLERQPQSRRLIDGLSPEQRFFISWAQTWRLNIRDQESRRRLTVDPHAPDRIRAVFPVMNHPDFERAFGRDPTGEDLARKIAIW